MPLLICGMHRSGTSAVAGAMSRLGLSLGDGLELIGVNDSQRSGHFEAISIVALNDDILRLHGGTWMAPPDIDDRAVAALARGELGDRARRLIDEHFVGDQWVAKDPRFCLTLPFWREVLNDDFGVLVSTRHPAKVVRSLAARDGMPPRYGLELWRQYHGRLFNAINGLETVGLHYDRFLAEPAELQRLAPFFKEIGLEVDVDALSREQLGLDPNLDHGDQLHSGALELDAATSELWQRLNAWSLGTAGVPEPERVVFPSMVVDLAAYASRARAELTTTSRELAALETDVIELRQLAVRRGSEIERLQSELAERTATAERYEAQAQQDRLRLETKNNDLLTEQAASRFFETRAETAVAEATQLQQRLDEYHSSRHYRLARTYWQLRNRLRLPLRLLRR